MSNVRNFPQKNFANSYAAYQQNLERELGREPTTQEILIEMEKFGWRFSDEYGRLPANELSVGGA